jgi:folate-binding protein YgfZ
MDWQQLFPAYAPLKDDEQSLLVTSFGETVADYPALSNDTVVSTNYRGFIQLNGPDSEKFLQGQVTCDLGQLSEHSLLNGAHLTPKGRVVFLFTVHKDKHDNLLLETHPSVVELAIASLQKYAVFFKTTITNVSKQFHSVIVSGPMTERLMDRFSRYSIRPISPSNFCISFISTRLQYEIGPLFENMTPAGQGYSDLIRVRSGGADVLEQTSEQYIVQMINLVAQGYINFKKGCYTGQEIVARAHYRGSVKRRMYRLTLPTKILPLAGENLTDAAGKTLGIVVGSARASDTHVEILATLALTSTDCPKMGFENIQPVDVSILPLPYDIPDTP